MTGLTDLDGTPIEQAARRLNTLHHHLDMPRRRREARVAAEGLLDVEVMARAMRDADCTGHHHGTSACPDRHCRSDTLPGYRTLAEAARAALLGEGA